MEIKLVTNNNNGLWLNRNAKKVCYNPWTHFEVNNPNGDVTMCVDVPTILGNVNKQSIEEIWNGKEYQRMRRMMFEQGAEKMCGPNCLLINGMKDYESFSWYQKISPIDPVFSNAVLNEEEILEGKVILKSKPRWMRFALSYKCNYSCYHCYQKEVRKQNITLPAEFLSDMKGLAQYYQVLFIFGGEPTIFREFGELLSLADLYPHLRLGLVTNASNLHKYIEQLKRVNWLFIAVSLDAASAGMYRKMRNSGQWEQVNQNILLLSELKKEKKFEFTIAMTVNSENCREIYDFVKLSDSYGATPKISLVTNPDGMSFYAKYMRYNKKKRNDIVLQIERSLKNIDYTADSTGLTILRRQFNRSDLSFYSNQLTSIIKNITPSAAKKLINKMVRS